MTAFDSSPAFPDASGPLALPGPAGALECLIERPEQDEVMDRGSAEDDQDHRAGGQHRRDVQARSAWESVHRLPQVDPDRRRVTAGETG